ncbi:MAG: family 20 glycosylhydrolase, partial [Bacteroidaceae bacterium]
MNFKLKSILATMCLAAITASADIINLTPKPKEMTTRSGTLVLNHASTVGCVGLPDSIIAEADKFISDINNATPLEVGKANTGQGNINLTHSPSYPLEGYKLDITTEGINIEATTTAGFYYAFQSIKKMLPQNVMAGVKDPSVEQYSLPLATINDEPRYGYRGFMLDVSRHFFTVAEVKRMIDIMAAYKMNVFHWHLTDDQV